MDLNAERIEGKTENKLAFEVGKQIFENRIAHEWLTTERAAQYLGISENALRIMVHRNQVRSHKLGRRLRFKARDLEALFVEKRS